MPFLHDHPKWLASKQKKHADWKENRKKSRATGKLKAPDTDPSSNASPTKLYLSKTFKDDLTSKVHLFNQEVDFLVNKAEKAVAAGSVIKG